MAVHYRTGSLEKFAKPAAIKDDVHYRTGSLEMFKYLCKINLTIKKSLRCKIFQY